MIGAEYKTEQQVSDKLGYKLDTSSESDLSNNFKEIQ